MVLQPGVMKCVMASVVESQCVVLSRRKTSPKLGFTKVTPVVLWSEIQLSLLISGLKRPFAKTAS